MAHPRTARSWFLVAGLLLRVAPAHAQTERESAARDLLLEQAQQARARGDHRAALEAATRAAAIATTPSVRAFIADEAMATNDPATAYQQARRCVREVEQNEALRNREAIRSACNATATRARTLVALLRVEVAASVSPGLAVTLDGEPLPSTLWGVPNPINAGVHRVLATRAGAPVFEQTLTASYGAELDVRVTPAAGSSSSSSDLGGRASSARPVAPWVLLGVGGAFAGTGVVLLALGATSAVPDGCVSVGSALECSNERAASAADGANALVIAGWALGSVGAAAALGGLLWGALARPAAEASNARAGSVVSLRPTLGGLQIAASF